MATLADRAVHREGLVWILDLAMHFSDGVWSCLGEFISLVIHLVLIHRKNQWIKLVPSSQSPIRAFFMTVNLFLYSRIS